MKQKIKVIRLITILVLIFTVEYVYSTTLNKYSNELLGMLNNNSNNNDLIISSDTSLKFAQNESYKDKFIKTLSRNIVNGKCIFTQNMIEKENTCYIIQNDYDLQGLVITIPKGCTLDFQGGSFSNGTIVGNKTQITNNLNHVIFSLSLKIKGEWNVNYIYDSWFEFNNTEKVVSNNIITNVFQLTNDNVNNIVIFNSPRTYWYELPYKGPANLGDLVDRDYSKLSSDEYSYLRIFTNVASNTEVVIDNEFRMIPTNQGFYRVFYIKGKHNITFRGKGGIFGDAHDHLYTDPFAGTNYYGEFGHIFSFGNCHNITIKELTISDAFGDNIYIGCSINVDKTEGFISSDIVIKNCNINYARRNGLTANAHNMFVSDCYFEGNGSDEIRGTAPRSAIDVESDYISIDSELGNKNIQISDCSFLNNKYDLSSTNCQTSDFEGISAFISNCNFTSPLRLNKTAAIAFLNCHVVAISSHDNSVGAWSGSRNISFVSCSFDELNPYLIVSAKTGGKNFINCSYPEDIEYSASYYLNMVPGRVVQFKIPRPLYGELEFTAIASLPSQCPSNTTKYRVGENVQCDILSTKITSRHDSTNRFSSYASTPVFSYIDTTDKDFYYIYFTLGSELINSTASNNWDAVVYLKSRTKYVLITKGETDAIYSPISGNVYGKLSDITRTYIDKSELPSSVVFPKEELYDACNASNLPTKLKSSQVGRQILILDGDRLPAFWNSFDSEFVAGDGWNATYPRKGYTSERPQLDNSKDIGYRYFDRTINKPIWWTGTKWVDAIGVEM